MLEKLASCSTGGKKRNARRNDMINIKEYGKFKVGDRVHWIYAEPQDLLSFTGTVADWNNPDPVPSTDWRDGLIGNSIPVLSNNPRSSWLYKPYFYLPATELILIERGSTFVVQDDQWIYCTCIAPISVSSSTSIGNNTGSIFNYCRCCRKEIK
jgi:hypothetical protein